MFKKRGSGSVSGLWSSVFGLWSVVFGLFLVFGLCSSPAFGAPAGAAPEVDDRGEMVVDPVMMGEVAAGGPAIPSYSGDLLNVQGRLTDASGAVVLAGSYSVHFAIYGAATGGSPLWEETQTVGVGREGIFNVLLGSSTRLSLQNLNPSSNYYLQVNIVGRDAMTPRQRLSAVPLAFTAKHLRGGKVFAAGGDGVGVTGLGIGAGGSFESTTGYGVKAVSNNNYGVWGVSTDNHGVYGRSVNGVGVRGRSSNGVGVSGTGATAGGSFESSGGYGVRAQTSAGYAAVYGENTKAISADNPGVKGVSNTGIGVYGQTNGGNDAGVYGKGAADNTAGVFGEGMTTNCIGIKGIAHAGNIAGGYFENVNEASATQVALQLGRGKILVRASDSAGGVAASNYHAAGRITLTASNTSLRVYNGFVTPSSIILLTVQSGNARWARIDNINTDSSPHSFRINIDRSADGNVVVGYLIIN